MKKELLILVIILVFGGTIGVCMIERSGNDEKEEKGDMTLGTFARYVEGEVIEVVDDKNVIIQITQNVYPLEVGDKMKVKYRGALYDAMYFLTKLKLNDVISVMFFDNALKKEEDGYYDVDVSEVYLVSGDEAISGNILEVYDDKVLIEIDSGDEKEDGQKVMVEYKEYYEDVNYEPQLTFQNPKTGDYVWVLYSTEDVVEVEGQKSIKCKMLVHTNG